MLRPDSGYYLEDNKEWWGLILGKTMVSYKASPPGGHGTIPWRGSWSLLVWATCNSANHILNFLCQRLLYSKAGPQDQQLCAPSGSHIIWSEEVWINCHQGCLSTNSTAVCRLRSQMSSQIFCFILSLPPCYSRGCWLCAWESTQGCRRAWSFCSTGLKRGHWEVSHGQALQ